MSLLNKLRDFLASQKVAKLRLENVTIKHECELAKSRASRIDDRNRELVNKQWELKEQIARLLAANLARLEAETKSLEGKNEKG